MTDGAVSERLNNPEIFMKGPKVDVPTQPNTIRATVSVIRSGTKDRTHKCVLSAKTQLLLEKAEFLATRRILANKWKKLGGKTGVLCEPCAWLSLGYTKCRKCGTAEGTIR